jgi:hypothetical protein
LPLMCGWIFKQFLSFQHPSMHRTSVHSDYECVGFRDTIKDQVRLEMLGFDFDGKF